MKRPAALILLSAVGGLSGCCHCLKPLPPDTRPLPAAISREEQLDALNRRATELPRIVMHAQSNGIEIDQQVDGKDKHESADGQLILQQHYSSHTADVYVQVKKVAQTLFEAGKNENEWWFAAYGNPPSGAVGPATSQPTLDSHTNVTLRADFIPELLAITEISPTDGELVVMRVDDLAGTNDLLIERPDAEGAVRLQREIVIDRRSGEVRRVSLFSPDGQMVIRAEMDHYEPVRYTGGATPAEGQTPAMPRHILIDCPSAHTRLGLTLERAEVPARLKGHPFETPDWQDLGIKPERVESNPQSS